MSLNINQLHIDSIQKSFGNKMILSDIYLSCKTGEIVGLLGANGSGKSTLLRIIFGLIEAENKYISINNKLYKGISSNNKDIFYLPQSGFIPNHFIILDILKLFVSEKDFQFLSKHSFFRDKLKFKVGQLSLGERRLLHVLISIFSDAKFVLLDEPFNAIAPIQVEDIVKNIKEQATYKGFIITDHNYSEIIKTADNLLLLTDGGIKKINNIEELQEYGYISEKGLLYL